MDFDDDEDLNRDEILDIIREEGQYMYDDGTMLIQCPERDELTACGLQPIPDPNTGESVMVCTGPVITTNDGVSKENQGVVESCRYNPDRLSD